MYSFMCYFPKLERVNTIMNKNVLFYVLFPQIGAC